MPLNHVWQMEAQQYGDTVVDRADSREAPLPHRGHRDLLNKNQRIQKKVVLRSKESFDRKSR